MLSTLVRRVWLGLLSHAPAPVLTRLDAWAQAQARRRAERRRQALIAARAAR